MSNNSEETVYVEFKIKAGKREEFLLLLNAWDQKNEDEVGGLDEKYPGNTVVIAYRADDVVSKRAALVTFVEAMELKLRKNEHKRNWREKPVEALIRLMMLELEEFRVAREFFSVAEARAELPDICNFAMMVHDRLGMLDQERNEKEQTRETEQLLERMRAEQNVYPR